MSSKTRRGGLGRGLGALIPTAPPAAPDQLAEQSVEQSVEQVPAPAQSSPTHSVGLPVVPSSEQALAAIVTGGTARPPITTEPLLPVEGASFADLPISAITANARQPRQVFDEDALSELTHSVREFGVLQPIVVRAHDTEVGSYELVMGERRLRAAVAAGLETIPAIIRSTADDAMLRDALLENIHRVQLNPLEEAAAYQQLLEEFGTTHDELAQRIGRSRPQVTNTIRLLNLSVPVQRRVAAGVLSAGHARALLGLEDRDAQDELAARIVAEGLSVRATEELVALHAGGHLERKAARQAPTHRIVAPAIGELADKLSDAFDTRVRVELGRRKGKITVEFASVDDLERIVAVMAPQLAVRTPPPPPAGDQPSEP